jgi:MYXO-CTERM domain-containing protein
MSLPANRVSEFCRDAPAPTVVRAHLRVGGKVGQVAVDVDEIYGAAAPTERIAQRFATIEDDETLLVSLAKDGTVIGSGWPVYKEKVSLEFGIPDMHETEAASLLMSPQCGDELRALRDKGVHPARIEPTSHRGCASCAVTDAPIDAGGLVLVVALALAVVRLKRARRWTSTDA